MTRSTSSKKFVRNWSVLLLLIGLARSEDPSPNSLTSCELEKLLKPLVSPEEAQTLQAQALRQQLAQILRQNLHEQVDNSIEEKRNLESLARAGYLRTAKNDYDGEFESEFKRSIQSLMRSGYLPSYRTDQPKRSIQSLARNGELIVPHKGNGQSDDTKRNIASLARDFNFPVYGKRYVPGLYDKRSLESLMRENNLPRSYYEEDKRNLASLAKSGYIPGKRSHVAALLRQSNLLDDTNRYENYPDTTEAPPDVDVKEEKRNLASVKAQYSRRFKRNINDNPNETGENNEARTKRQIDYFEDAEQYPTLYDDNMLEYDEMLQELNDLYPSEEKRFLGRLPQMGKPKTTTSPKTRFH